MIVFVLTFKGLQLNVVNFLDDNIHVSVIDCY